MVVVYCLTRNLYEHIKSNVNNILYYHPDAKFYLIIEDDYIEALKNCNNITFINVNKINIGIDDTNPNWNNKWTYMNFLRCFIPNLIKEDRCLYLDCDTMILGKIDELYNMDLGNNLFGGCKFFLAKNYGTAVMVMNLKQMRKEHLTEKVIDEFNKKVYPLPDEQVLNLLCKDRIKGFHRKFCSCEFNGESLNPVLVHCTPIKQWTEYSPYYNEYLKFKSIKEVLE